MARNEEARRRLAELVLRHDFSGASVDDLVKSLKEAIAQQDELATFIRRGLLELNSREVDGKRLSYDRIAQLVGISRSKANRLANKAE